MKAEMIAPCGMNCSLCISYQFGVKDINRLGFKRKYCPGCIVRGKHCLHMRDACTLVGKGLVRFCYECSSYPCARLSALDQRYRTKYHMSMIDNLNQIRDNGMDGFLNHETAKWRCPKCAGTICCHNGLCLDCDLEVLKKHKTYRWGMDGSQ
jgi:hypothetical protein